jgi:excisionase family DNA binding protein
MMSNALLLLEEVAQEARATISTVRHWVSTGKLASVRPGRRRLVRRSDLEAFLGCAGAEAGRGDPRRCRRG